jgi:hypothetical protein
MNGDTALFGPYAPNGYIPHSTVPQLEINGTNTSTVTDYHGLGIDCTASGAECDTNGSGPIYYHIVFDGSGWTYIEYWIFYRFNDASGAGVLYTDDCTRDSGSPRGLGGGHRRD